MNAIRPPAPPEGRHVIDAPLPPVLIAVVLGALIAALVVWSLPRIVALPETVHARALRADCLPPSELEQLHIVVIVREGRLVTECMYVGPRGAYQRKKPI